MEIAYRDHEVDGVRTVIGGIVDIRVYCPDKGAGLYGQAGAGDEPYRVLFPGRCRSRAGFDNIDTKVCKPGCNL